MIQCDLWLYPGRLKLKIPWKDLYNDAWVASVEKVVVVAVPNTSISYDSEREDRLRQDAKMSQLHNAEEARKKQQEVGKGKLLYISHYQYFRVCVMGMHFE